MDSLALFGYAFFEFIDNLNAIEHTLLVLAILFIGLVLLFYCCAILGVLNESKRQRLDEEERNQLRGTPVTPTVQPASLAPPTSTAPRMHIEVVTITQIGRLPEKCNYRRKNNLIILPKRLDVH